MRRQLVDLALASAFKLFAEDTASHMRYGLRENQREQPRLSETTANILAETTEEITVRTERAAQPSDEQTPACGRPLRKDDPAIDAAIPAI